MPASDWLPAEVVDAFEAEYGTLAEALLWELTRPGSGDKLRDLGVVDRQEGFGQPNVYVPRASERDVWEFMAELRGFEIDADGSAGGAKSNRGKWEKHNSEPEANKAAEIYLNNRGLTPWEVWVRYKRVRDATDAGRLSKNMVARLIGDLNGDEPLLVWDAAAERDDGGLGRLRLPSGELWANFGRGVLPRRAPAS